MASRNSNKAIYCGDKFLWPTKTKKRIRTCACNVEYIRAINPNFYEAAVRACNGNSQIDTKNFLCDTYDPAFLLSNYQYQGCGLTFEDTLEHEIFIKEQQQIDENEKQTANQQRNILFIVAGIVAALLVAFLYTNSQKSK